MKKLILRAAPYICSVAILISLLGNASAINAHSASVNVDNHIYTSEEEEKIALTDRIIQEYFSSHTGTRDSGSLHLDVPLYQQENDHYCGPASTQMVLKYLIGTLYTQNALATELGTTLAGTSSGNICSVLNDYAGAGTYQVTNVHNQTSGQFNNSVLFSLGQNYPLIANVKDMPAYPTAGHFIAIIGYYYYYGSSGGELYLTYNDPHFNDNYYGQFSMTAARMELAIDNNGGTGGNYIRYAG